MACFTRQHIFNQGINCSKPRFLGKPGSPTSTGRLGVCHSSNTAGTWMNGEGARLWRGRNSLSWNNDFLPCLKTRQMAMRKLQWDVSHRSSRWGPAVLKGLMASKGTQSNCSRSNLERGDVRKCTSMGAIMLVPSVLCAPLKTEQLEGPVF